jgi:hypothetical protein
LNKFSLLCLLLLGLLPLKAESFEWTGIPYDAVLITNRVVHIVANADSGGLNESDAAIATYLGRQVDLKLLAELKPRSISVNLTKISGVDRLYIKIDYATSSASVLMLDVPFISGSGRWELDTRKVLWNNP